jgi:hypothetical protein
MNAKVQLKHPHGKKAVKIDKAKYDLLKPALMKYLRNEGEATLTELTREITKAFKSKGQTFEGSLPWHLEWVKLDLEARNLLRRIPDTAPQRYGVVR